MHASRDERGYAMAALLVGLSIMAVLMSVAMPVWSQFTRREREEELIGAVSNTRVPSDSFSESTRTRFRRRRRAGGAAVPAQEIQGPDHQ